MSRDSHISYAHMKQPNHILFQEKWDVDKLPFDDIEINPNFYYHNPDNILQQFLANPEDTENDLNIVNGNNPMFNSSYANRMQQKNKSLNWKDLGVTDLLSNDKPHIPDQTILSKPGLGLFESPTDIGSNTSFQASFDLTNQISTANDDDDDDDEGDDEYYDNGGIGTGPNRGGLGVSNPHILAGADISTSEFNSGDPLYRPDPMAQQHNNNTSSSNNNNSNNNNYPFTTPIVPNRTTYHNFTRTVRRRPEQQRSRRSSADNQPGASSTGANPEYETPQSTHARIIR